MPDKNNTNHGLTSETLKILKLNSGGKLNADEKYQIGGQRGENAA